METCKEIGITPEAFEAAYQIWREELEAESPDALKVADLTSARLFQILRHSPLTK
jgi:hypothetical protein